MNKNTTITNKYIAKLISTTNVHHQLPQTITITWKWRRRHHTSQYTQKGIVKIKKNKYESVGEIYETAVKIYERSNIIKF